MANEPGRTEPLNIQIDRHQYTITQTVLSGAQLRALPTPRIGADRELYEVRAGQEDVLVRDDQPVSLYNGSRFFTAPGHINPGTTRA